MTLQRRVFLSYARSDDDANNGQISKIFRQVEAKVRVWTKSPFEVYQDIRSNPWGVAWEQNISSALQSSDFFVAIVTPLYFIRQECRREIELFAAREQSLKRTDLILPLYYASCPQMDDLQSNVMEPTASLIRRHHYYDWRTLRGRSLRSQAVQDAIRHLTQQLTDALDRYLTPSIVHFAPSQSAFSLEQQPLHGNAHPASRKKQLLVVDSIGRGEFLRISDAIEAAEPGATIHVRRGIYTENLTITKPLRILGDGDCSAVIVRTKGKCTVFFDAARGRLENLSIHQIGDSQGIGIEIAGGQLKMVHCDVSSDGGACVAVRGGAIPLLRMNRIHDGHGSGILIDSGSRGRYEENDIDGNTGPNIEITEGANPVVRNNRIRSGKNIGIYVHGGGKGTLTGNDIANHAFSGIEINTKSSAKIRGNTIHGGQNSGILIQGRAKATIEDNEIFNTTFSAVEVKTQAQAAIRNNHIHSSRMFGIFIKEKGRAIVEGNSIFGHAWAGLSTQYRGTAVARHNHIYQQAMSGVYIINNGLGTFEDNQVYENRDAGFTIKSGSNPQVRGNTIMRNKEYGICICAGGKGTYTNNEVTANGLGGWGVSEDSTPLIERMASDTEPVRIPPSEHAQPRA